jgi:HD-GYP domain-containing protein (c-di-GMP phosphodiesterase class II)
MNSDLVRALVKCIECKDRYTAVHGCRTGEIAALIAPTLGFPKEKLDEVIVGGMLHDLGKIGIRDAILHHDGPLSPEEFNEMKQHPIIGAEILKGLTSMSGIIPYVLYHQEKFDGSGYPEGLQGEAIPIEGRLISVADALDAITSERPHSKRIGIDVAIAEIHRCSGSHFDPKVVEALEMVMRDNAIAAILAIDDIPEPCKSRAASCRGTTHPEG